MNMTFTWCVFFAFPPETVHCFLKYKCIVIYHTTLFDEILKSRFNRLSPRNLLLLWILLPDKKKFSIFVNATSINPMILSIFFLLSDRSLGTKLQHKNNTMFCIESQMTEVLGHYATEYIYLTAGNADFLYVVCRVILLHPIKEKVKIISEWEIEIWKGWRLPVLPVMRGKTTFQGRLAFINYQVYVYKPACLDQSIQTQKPLGISLTHTRKTIRYFSYFFNPYTENH